MGLEIRLKDMITFSHWKEALKGSRPFKNPLFCTARTYAASAMVTSTSTPGSMLIEVICFTISEGLWRSITLLWILIWNLSQVLEPSPQGVFLVVILSTLVGILTGPFTLSSLSLAPLMRSAHTFSRDLTFLEKVCSDLIRGAKDKELKGKGPVRMPTKVRRVVKKEPRRRLSTPSQGRIGMISRPPQSSKFVRLARPWSTELLEPRLPLMV